ncbi:hypothetical protein OG244_28480 [Streptomyces brevispora]|uniref:hypothetical protein n=1 Tax=Streptomyces brevispora TaxID=887462 RepID=UPI002E35415D|nr:hypothetical protein [Streptomyces brevispora]
MIPTGPIDSEPPGFRSSSEQQAILRDTLHAAGVELGAYDCSIIDWLTVSPGWEWGTVATIASWVQRAGGAGADPLATDATEYRVHLPENGGETLLVRRQALAHGAGWAVSTYGRGGGLAWTKEGWQDPISALSVDRLFCWPTAVTAVSEARRALANP